MVGLVFSDVDGVLTDSKIHIGDEGEAFKSFNVKDGYGIAKWQEGDGREFVIVTSRESKAVNERAAELGINEVHQDVENKGVVIENIANRLGFDLQESAYIGDDLTDLEAINKVKKPCCPADAPQKIKSECCFVSQFNGGDGAVREILRYLQRTSGKVLGVIPARYGSTRLPGKPLKDLAGKPMIQHVYERANKADLIDNLIVATDDSRIAETVESFGGKVMMTSSDHSTGTDRVAEVARKKDAEFTINIQGDEPLIQADVIDSVVSALRTNTPQVATPISPIKRESALTNENTVKVVTDNEGKALYFSRSKIPHGGSTETTFKHIGLYGFRTNLLLDYIGMESDLESAEDLEQLRLLENGYEIQTVTTDYDSKEVNVKSDIPVVEQELEQDDENQ